MARRAFDIAARNDARLSFMHVVEYLPFIVDNELMLPPALEVETQLMSNARAQLAKLMQRLNGPAAAEQLVELGSTKAEILRIATERAVDLIVVGSHGRHGWARMLGSTADAVLHGAACDVLAVRVPE
ncbi:MAG: universal stress protein [Pseudomonadota bacterium]